MEYNLKVNQQEANLILQALGEMPARMSMSLIVKLQAQAQSQATTPAVRLVKPPKEENEKIVE